MLLFSADFVHTHLKRRTEPSSYLNELISQLNYTHKNNIDSHACTSVRSAVCDPGDHTHKYNIEIEAQQSGVTQPASHTHKYNIDTIFDMHNDDISYYYYILYILLLLSLLL